MACSQHINTEKWHQNGQTSNHGMFAAHKSQE
jgi:hypothetical protein